MTCDPVAPMVPLLDASTADALSQVIFAQDDFDQVHEPWRQLISGPLFRYRSGLSEEERTALSYERLRAANALLEHPLALAADSVRLAGAHEWIAMADPTCASLLSLHQNLYLGSLVEADKQPARTMDDSTGVFMATEVGCGNDAASLRTTATWDPTSRTFDLHTPHAVAQKFMPNSSGTGGAKTAVVAARLLADATDHGVLLFHVPLTFPDGSPHPGIRIRRLPERAGSALDHCVTAFDHVQLPAHALLEGEQGRLADDGTFTSSISNPRARFLHSIRRVTPGRLSMAACSIGVARSALHIATLYAHHRYVAGRPDRVPIAAHRTHAERLVTRIAQTYAMTFLHRQNVRAWATCTPHNRDRTERDIALAKAWLTWTARETVIEARERCGAQGMIPFNGLSGLAEALDGAVSAEGDNLPVMAKAGSELLFEHPTPPLPAGSWDPSLTSLSDLRQLLTLVEALTAARARAGFHDDHGEHPRGLARWNRASLPAVEAAELYTLVQAADAFAHATQACPHPGARTLLTEMARLFLLQQLQPHTGTLQAQGYLSGTAVLAIPHAIEDCLDALSPHMLTLTHAFAVPEGYLASVPIAHATYQHAYDFDEAPWHAGTDGPDTSCARPWSLAVLRVATAVPPATESTTNGSTPDIHAA